ncbi:MAG: helix-turn-helix domain-containing protein [Deltaproteobacteria bacterium]|nr:helix-turn-helix domain-containing protein [Deltaproteobacteria bacterium]
MANRVSENIRKLRQKKRTSQIRFSKSTNLALDNIVKIKIKENLTLETLKKITKALDVSISDLFKE